MDIKGIITRKTGSTIEISEMQFVVEGFIKERKDKDVTINLSKDINPRSPFGSHDYIQQVRMLNKAFDTASIWYMKNKFKVK